ncbi:MAG: FAD-dependent oxidoreductase, partial [Polyangiaceae bacterium]|nr:FAD-dependent oxidoreductase [Polyangiaceae bacterium]
MSHVSRRALLSSIGAAFLAHQLVPDKAPFGGRLLGASHTRGHLLRGAELPAPTAPPEQTDVVIVGAGASGLGAAYRLRESGLALTVLELEDFVGGTSAWGDDGVVSHPWGAHYLPAPGPEARAVLRLLSDLGVVTGWDAAGLPRFDEERLCHAPEERLFYRGRWHEGLTPTAALEPAERAELARFEAAEAELEEAVGRDGRPVFQIPVERSSRDPRWLELDRISMADWLLREGYRTPFLRWYVDYATRDDFGGHAEDVSAWAGLHYFAARKLRTEQLAGSHYLVWPEGNGWLLRRMLDRTPLRAVTGAVALGVEPTARGVEVRYFDA